MTAPLARQPARSADHFTFVHIVLWLAYGILVMSAEEIDRDYGLYFMVIPLLGIPLIVLTIVWLIAGGLNIWAKRWRRLASIACAPLISLVLFGFLVIVGLDAGWVHFHLVKSRYEQEIRQLPLGAVRYREWSWGGTGGAASVETDMWVI